MQHGVEQHEGELLVQLRQLQQREGFLQAEIEAVSVQQPMQRRRLEEAEERVVGSLPALLPILLRPVERKSCLGVPASRRMRN